MSVASIELLGVLEILADEEISWNYNAIHERHELRAVSAPNHGMTEITHAPASDALTQTT